MVSPFIWEFFVLIIASVLCWYIRTQEESDLFQGHTLFYCLFHQKWDHNLQNEDRAVWRRFATGCWAHKLIRKQFAEVINQVWSKVILFINLHNQTFFRTIIYKMKIMLHWWRLVTRNWAHNLSRKLFTEGINQVRGSFSHKLTYNQPSFCNQWSQPLLAFTKKKKKKKQFKASLLVLLFRSRSKLCVKSPRYGPAAAQKPWVMIGWGPLMRHEYQATKFYWKARPPENEQSKNDSIWQTRTTVWLSRQIIHHALEDIIKTQVTVVNCRISTNKTEKAVQLLEPVNHEPKILWEWGKKKSVFFKVHAAQRWEIGQWWKLLYIS